MLGAHPSSPGSPTTTKPVAPATASEEPTEVPHRAKVPPFVATILPPVDEPIIATEVPAVIVSEPALAP